MKRVVITSVGAVTPVGLDAESMWQNVKQGKHGFAPISSFDT